MVKDESELPNGPNTLAWGWVEVTGGIEGSEGRTKTEFGGDKVCLL